MTTPVKKWSSPETEVPFGALSLEDPAKIFLVSVKPLGKIII